MSDTPRTDAKASDWNEFNIYDGDAVVPASFARILERENAALRADKERLDWLQGRDTENLYWDIIRDECDIRSAIDDCMNGRL